MTVEIHSRFQVYIYIYLVYKRVSVKELLEYIFIKFPLYRYNVTREIPQSIGGAKEERLE